MKFCQLWARVELLRHDGTSQIKVGGRLNNHWPDPREISTARMTFKAIQDYIQHYNRNPQPFPWVASASKIIRKVNKYKETLETGDLASAMSN